MHKITAYWVVSILATFLSLAVTEVKAGGVKTCDQYSSKALNKKADRFKKEIARAAERHEVDPALIKSVITAESCFRPTVYSCRDAGGLMQLIPATAERFGAFDVFDPAENIDAGARYLRYLLKRYKGSVTHAIAAYNAGESRVEKGQKRITVPFAETRRYVGRVLNAYAKFSEEKQEAKLLLAKWHAAEKTWRAKPLEREQGVTAGNTKVQQPHAILAVYKKEQPASPSPQLNIHWIGSATTTHLNVADAATQ